MVVLCQQEEGVAAFRLVPLTPMLYLDQLSTCLANKALLACSPS